MEIHGYILEQPQIVDRVLREVPVALTGIPGISEVRDFYLVGAGTSMNALIAVEPTLSRIGPCRIRGPLAFLAETQREMGREDLAIFLSQTGTSATTIRAVEEARRRGMRTVTLTSDPQSPIAQVSSAVLVIPVGPEAVGPKTKGYTASVLTLLLLAWGATGEKVSVPRFSEELSGLIEEGQKACRDLATVFRETDFIMVMGQGRHYATALEGSLKITEMSGIPAAGFDTEEALHGRFHALGSRSLAFFVAATAEQYGLALRAADVLSELGVGVRILNLVGMPASVHDLGLSWPRTDGLVELDLLSSIVPFQLLAWNLAGERGIVPEQMRYPHLSRKLGIKYPINP